MQIFPPNNGGDRGRGYQTLGSPTGMTLCNSNNNLDACFIFLACFIVIDRIMYLLFAPG